MNLAKLYASMLLTVLVVTTISTIVLYFILTLFTATPFEIVLFIVIAAYILQWLFAPYFIEAIYRVEPLRDPAYSNLIKGFNEIVKKNGITPPKLMVANIDIPNAFAYGSPLTGYKIAVTRGLLRSLPEDEVMAVLGHEIGHIKHRDTIVIMAVGLIPAIILWLGEYLVRWGWLFGYYRARREESLAPYALLGLGVLFLIIGFLLNLGILYLSRLREYYADAHSATIIPNGARLLQRALARIMVNSGWLRKIGYNLGKYNQLKMLFISSPDHVIMARYQDIDYIIENIKRQKVSILAELFSTHPHPAKRLRFLDQFIKRESY
ncbi:MAG: zinc metalloprotease HtpX [Thermoprotei archaeon]|nr:MAG: zinc metalloprotease HtpX [Thermoprotei archaeon]